LDKLRAELQRLLAEGRKRTDPEVVAVSQQLDRLVNEEIKKPAGEAGFSSHNQADDFFSRADMLSAIMHSRTSTSFVTSASDIHKPLVSTR
jgi:hypothetical protein